MAARRKSGGGRKRRSSGTGRSGSGGGRSTGRKKRTPRGGRVASSSASGAASRSRETARTVPAATRNRRPSFSPVGYVTELLEHAAAGALRRVVEVGGREMASWLPQADEMRREAGAYLRELRELAGLTVDELAAALELSDEKRLEAVEAGTATLSFELVLRLAAILARHDPLPFVSRMVRSYNPVLWELLEDWGLGRLPLQLERERSFVNILRGHDDARALDDATFEEVLAFTRAAFEMALAFASRATPRRRARPGREPAPPQRSS